MAVKIEVVESDHDKIRVRMKGVQRSYANALRRLAMNYVPTMAIDEVVVLENSSVIYDEMIAHRLGLVPLKTDLSRYVLPEDCDCENELGCKKCRVLLVLDTESTKLKTVYSGDLVSEDPEVCPTSATIPIAKLPQGRKIKLEAYAKLGRGLSHAKWQAVSVSVLKEVDGTSDFELFLESVGSLTAADIFREAADSLRRNLELIASKTKELK